MNKDKKAILVEELCLTGYPKAAILAGMKSLQSEDLKSVKFAHLVDAIKSKMTYEEEVSTRCDHCDGRGAIFMRNKDKYQFALACVCVNGNRLQHQGNARWNGMQFQESRRHGTLELEHPEFVLGNR